jgi:VWFA-related protein
VFVLPLAFAAFLAAPQSQSQPYMEAIEVRIHNVDVVVTDANGNVVTGLTREDFELLEDGKLQKVSNFAAYSETAAAPTAGTNPTSAEQAPDAIGTVQPPPPRTFVFFIDELGLVPSTRDDLLRNLRAFTSTMRAGDRATVLRPIEATEIELAWTSDPAHIEQDLVRALENAVQTRKGLALANEYYWYRRDMIGVESQAEARLVAKRAAGRTMHRMKQRLGTMRAIIAALAPIDGRKVLINVTQSFSGEPGREFLDDYISRFRDANVGVANEPLDAIASPDPRAHMNEREGAERRVVVRDLRPAIADVARIASTNGVTIYTIRPESDLTLMDAAPDQTSFNYDRIGTAVLTGSPEVNRTSLTFLQNAIENTKGAVIPLADITGGRQFAPNDRFEDVTRRIASDLNSYYSLAYHAQGGVDQPHRIVVRVKNRPELNVRARSEVERKSSPRELTDRVVSSLIAADTPNDLGIAVRAERSKGKPMKVDILIPIAALDFEHAGKVHRARYSAHYAITGKSSDFVSGVDLDRTIEIPDRDWEKARQQHWTHTITVSENEQAYRIAVGVMDLRNQRAGVTTMDVAP